MLEALQNLANCKVATAEIHLTAEIINLEEVAGYLSTTLTHAEYMIITISRLF